ncbi:MAG: hypothetical protein HY393_01070 [Candidatus Diapherotrites archaeon]|nr:hypothetical protein [Candidatus Diapherotrites archaeon]
MNETVEEPTVKASAPTPASQNTGTHQDRVKKEKTQGPAGKEEWLEFHLKRQERERAHQKKLWTAGLAGLVLVLAIGLIAWNFAPQNINNQQPPPVQGTPLQVKVQLIVDAACPICFKSNTILKKFDEVGIQYDLELYDIAGPEGKALADQYLLTLLPTAIVSLKGMEQNPQIKAAMDATYSIANAHYIVPEGFLDNQPRTISYASNPGACIQGEKPQVLTFTDYYCEHCALADLTTHQLELDFNTEVEFKTLNFVFPRSTQEAEEAAIKVNKSLYCLQGAQTNRKKYEACLFDGVNKKYETAETGILKTCAIESGMSAKDLNTFTSCIENKDTDIQIVGNVKEAFNYAVRTTVNKVLFVPFYVLDCKYSVVGHNSLKSSVCGLHPELSYCKTNTPICPKECRDLATPGQEVCPIPQTSVATLDECGCKTGFTCMPPSSDQNTTSSDTNQPTDTNAIPDANTP